MISDIEPHKENKPKIETFDQAGLKSPIHRQDANIKKTGIIIHIQNTGIFFGAAGAPRYADKSQFNSCNIFLTS